MRLVIVESPYAGKTQAEIDYNVEYARACVRDCLMRGEAPYASHLLYTQPGVLRDEIPEERKHGIEAGIAWKLVADATIVYADLGVTQGMQWGIDAARDRGRPIEERKLGGKWALPRETINEQTEAWWHGCWLDSGHHLFKRDGRNVYDVFPFNEHTLDGGFAPCRSKRGDKIVCISDRERYPEELPQGQFLRHYVEGITMLAWWDRTQGDKRGASNSVYLVRGEHTTEQMLKWFPKHFPKQAAQLEAAGIKLVEVKLSL